MLEKFEQKKFNNDSNRQSPDNLPQIETPSAIFRLPVPINQNIFFGERQVELKAEELEPLFPVWPVPYSLTLAYNSSKSLTLVLFDAEGETIQLNLYFLSREFKGSVLLGDSTASSTNCNVYGPQPSKLTAAWIKDRVIPWLEKKGFDKLYVRAFFKNEESDSSANNFFKTIGFVDESKFGNPYLVYHMNTNENLSNLTIPTISSNSEFSFTPIENFQPNMPDILRTIFSEDFYQSLSEMQTANLDYFSMSWYFNEYADVERAHAKIKEKYEGISNHLYARYYGASVLFADFIKEGSKLK